MYLGEIMESGNVEDIFLNSKHPYTQALISSIPTTDPSRRRRRIVLEGMVPSAINPPSGCRFHTRCPFAKSICSKEQPKIYTANEEHLVKCHFTDLEFE
jgi:oligopeptide/dipeptide ABC transporter ATP-binding protein